MKRPDVEQMLSEMAAHELLSWRAFYEVKAELQQEAAKKKD